MKKFVGPVTIAVILVTSCASEPRPIDPASAASPKPAPSKREGEGPARRFDRLTMSLELRSDHVAPGGKIPSMVSVRNDTRRPVTDPSCLLASYSFALLPAESPNGELWGQVIVDCSGKFVMKRGYVNAYKGPTFVAADKYGEPLPPGDYVAVMEIRQRSERFVQPVTVRVQPGTVTE